MHDPPSHVVLDLLERLAADRLSGELRPLAHYLGLFPGHEEAVAEEYLAAVHAAPADAEGEAGAPLEIGPYRIVRELGRGGQAVVWLAEDERLGRQVALKVVPLPPGTEGLSARFQREARATAGLEHAHVCSVYDAGVDGHQAWIAMRYVDGETLAQWLARRTADRPGDALPEPDDVRDVVGWVQTVARALHAAHERGIVHRDMKPGNVMIAEDGAPVVLDFGLALLDEEGPQLTLSGSTLGTPAYMSPEQLGFGDPTVGPASDIWSLGASLYECCVGRRPFSAPTRNGLVHAITDSEPPDPRKLTRHVSADLTAILQTALAKTVEHRYSTAADMADDLGRVLRGEPIAVRPIGPFVRLARWSRRNPLAATLSGALAAVLLIGMAYALTTNRALGRSNTDLLEANDQLVAKTAEAEASALLARERTGVATAALAEYERMADSRRLSDARREADSFYPIHPDLVPALEAWQERIKQLLARAESHRSALHAMRVRAAPYDDAVRRRDYALELEKIRGLETSIPVVTLPYRGKLQEQVDALTAALDVQRSWDFGEDIDAQFRHDALTRLVDELDTAITGKRSVVASVARRLALSRRVHVATVEEHVSDWEGVRQRVALNPRYPGLDLAPQIGLVPLGPDPASGLEEFLLWESQQTGVPARDTGGQLIRGDETGVVLVLIPGGAFFMGAQADQPEDRNHDPQARKTEAPVTRVELDPYLLSKYEITQAQWTLMTGANPSSYEVGYELSGPGLPITPRNPVETVSWFEATDVLRRFGLTLPTEAQWERAARAGGYDLFAGTSDASALTLYCNLNGREGAQYFASYSKESTDGYLLHAPVGSFRPNAFGLYDMSGNVWEWVRDGFSSYLVQPEPGDGERPAFTENHIYRGGSWGVLIRDQRVAYRMEINADIAHNALGVRPARRLTPLDQ